MASIIESALKASQRTKFFNHKLYPSMERLMKSDSTLTQLWNPIALRKPEHGGDTFTDTSLRTRVIRYNVLKASII
jgi:hypothetical protein